MRTIVKPIKDIIGKPIMHQGIIVGKVMDIRDGMCIVTIDDEYKCLFGNQEFSFEIVRKSNEEIR